MVKATWQGKVLAESDKTIVVEGNHYFPADAIQREFFEESSTTTICPWKGTASYYNIRVEDSKNPDAAWYYATPKPEAEDMGIRNHVAFWKGVEVK